MAAAWSESKLDNEIANNIGIKYDSRTDDFELDLEPLKLDPQLISDMLVFVVNTATTKNKGT